MAFLGVGRPAIDQARARYVNMVLINPTDLHAHLSLLTHTLPPHPHTQVIQELHLNPNDNFSLFRSQGHRDELTHSHLHQQLQQIPIRYVYWREEGGRGGRGREKRGIDPRERRDGGREEGWREGGREEGGRGGRGREKGGRRDGGREGGGRERGGREEGWREKE